MQGVSAGGVDIDFSCFIRAQPLSQEGFNGALRITQLQYDDWPILETTDWMKSQKGKIEVKNVMDLLPENAQQLTLKVMVCRCWDQI